MQSHTSRSTAHPPSSTLAARAAALAIAATMGLTFATEASAEIDWTQKSGSKINLLLISHPFVESLKPLLPEFTKLTGIEVTFEELAEQPGFEKLLADLSSGTGTYDAFMTSPLNNWQYATAGWLEPLDPVLGDAKLTDAAEYDLADFAPGVLASGRWTREPMKGIGEGELWGLPINFETYQIAYRPSLMKELGLEVPKTYKELVEMAPKLSAEGPNGKI